MKKLIVTIGLLAIVALLGLGTVPLSASPVSGAGVSVGETQTYIVLYKQTEVPSDSKRSIESAGGILVNSFDAIGVAIARSANPLFGKKMQGNNRVECAACTAGYGMQLSDEIGGVYDASELEAILPAEWGDQLSGRQWDMRQIHVPEAHAITGGSSSVVVGVIDTGIDYTHPDLAPNIDFANSASLVGGVPNTDPAAWNDDNGHGTHVAGTIAAAANGIGIVGVAPNVKLAAIKAGNADGFFFPEAVVGAFMWAAIHHIDVVNNSYFADPWLFNSRNDPEQRAIWKAEQRAISYAIAQGVTVVAAIGNENLDLSKTNVDTVSFDTSLTPTPRVVTNAAVVIPAEIPGVIAVSANGANLTKAYYSSYGVGVTQVVAPGGDRRFQDPGDGSRGYVLSTYPGNRYALAQGTSMAAPHVAGVAALIISQFGTLPPGPVQAMINATADPQPPEPNPFDPGGSGDWLATCTGGPGYNSFYGHGEVDALSAVASMPRR
jgi:lantibiotic leader peptide-processing serine protease